MCFPISQQVFFFVCFIMYSCVSQAQSPFLMMSGSFICLIFVSHHLFTGWLVQFYNNLSLGVLNSSETECQLVTKKHVLYGFTLSSSGLIGSQPCRSSTPRRSPPASLSWLQRCMVVGSFFRAANAFRFTSFKNHKSWPASRGKSWLSASVLVSGCAAAWRCTILQVQQATRRGGGWRLASLCNGQHCWLSNQMCWFGRTTGREEWCNGWSVCSTFQSPLDWVRQLEILWTWMAHEEDVASSYAWLTSEVLLSEAHCVLFLRPRLKRKPQSLRRLKSCYQSWKTQGFDEDHHHHHPHHQLPWSP